MKYKLILTLLKQRNQYLFQLLVISIFIIIFNSNEISCMENAPEETASNVAVQNVASQEPITRDEIAINLATRIIITSGIALIGSLIVGQAFIGFIPLGIYYIIVPLAYPSGIPNTNTVSSMQKEIASVQDSLMDQITAMERTMTSIEQHLDSRLISPVKPCEPCETVFYKVLEDTTLWETFINIFPIYSFLFVIGLGIFFYKIKLKQR